MAEKASEAGTAPHILICDDDKRLRRLLATYLKEQGFLITASGSAEEARHQLQQFDFDLLILDVMMPGEDGLSLTKSIRTESNVPILMLTALGEADDRIRGLEHGVDDYLTKPFEPKELELRLQAILRRQPAPAEQATVDIVFGPCRYDPIRQALRYDGSEVPLTAAEINLLAILTRQPNTPVSREDLAEAGEGSANLRTVDVQITRLRRKIEDDPRQPRYLQTVRGTGYILRTDAP